MLILDGTAVRSEINIVATWIESTTMPQIIDENEQDKIEVFEIEIMGRQHRREKLSALLPAIASEVASGLQTAGLPIPIFFTIPRAGDALVTVITTIDPSDEDWNAACKIVCGIVENRIGTENLVARDVACISAGLQMGAADVCVDAAALAEPNS
jgi:hypothetical protein